MYWHSYEQEWRDLTDTYTRLEQWSQTNVSVVKQGKR
jgi:hypothetical protein